MTGITARFILPIALTMSVLPLALAGCGNSGTSSAVKEHAFLTPPPLENRQNTPIVAVKSKSVAKISGDNDKDVFGPAVASKAEAAKKTSTTKKLKAVKKSGAVKKIRAAKKADKAKKTGKAGKIITAKAASSHKQSNRKLRRQKAIAKAVVTPKKHARAKPVVVTSPVIVSSIVKAKPKVEMVPVKAIPVQVAREDTPQAIIDAFKEDMGMKVVEQMVSEADAPEKVAKAESVPIEPSFGKSEYRFSGQ